MALSGNNTLTGKQTVLSLTAIYTTVFTWGISFAGLIPLMALTLENNGESTVRIGIMGAITPIGVILAAPYVPAIVQRLGTSKAIFVTNVLAMITVALLPVFDSYGGWLALRFASGLAGAVPWIVTESWLNAIAPEEKRSRVTALYGAVMAASFATGPFILTVIGIDGVMPYVYCAGAMAISIVPLILIWNLAPTLSLSKGLKLSGFMRTMPTLLAAALVCGMVDMSLFSFLPIWGLRVGFTEDLSLLLLSIFVLGNVVLQLPIGWIADHTNKRMVLLVCGVVAVIGPIFVTVLSGNLLAMGAVLFLWGGCAWALYTVSLAMLGQRFQGSGLTAASAVFVIAYEIANVVGPPAAGYAIELWEPHGLMVFMGLSALAFVILLCVRGIVRVRHSQESI